MGSSLAHWDPLGPCHGVEAAPPVLESRRIHQDHRSRPGESEEAMIQEAMLRSLADRQKHDIMLGEDVEFQQALHLSLTGDRATCNAEESGPTEETLRLQALLEQMGLRRLDVGSTNLSEGGTMLSNQCFYLAIARSWLAESAGGNGLLVRESALQLKRQIESCVLAVRGDEQNELGEESEAYTDYLTCAVRGDGPGGGSLITDLAIVVFASAFGGLEAYEGRGYARLPREQQVANLALVWHRPGHFEAIVAFGREESSSGKVDITLRELVRLAEQEHVSTAIIQA
eukprot:TRINITY_DN24052_c0_g2_i1.p1 TRINITY_DN24052_c0_g2~~TRINITY_DN24052_c0_g2_i1.p1  ORF type:complete len:286 (-),score=50.04 TRINITY_DN24052_c0_g2_i1:73-930(-)